MTDREAALNDAIDAWGVRHKEDPDPGNSDGWTFGWYALRWLGDRGLIVIDTLDLAVALMPVAEGDEEGVYTRDAAIGALRKVLKEWLEITDGA